MATTDGGASEKDIRTPAASTADEGVATPDSLASDYFDYELYDSCEQAAPTPGKTFIIRAASSGRVLTWMDGKVVLAPPGEHGSFVWDCVESDGWLGFRNPASGKYLGHTKGELLVCSADVHSWWEHFVVRPHQGKAYTLAMKHWSKLVPVGKKTEDNEEKIVRFLNGEPEGLVWEFFEKR